VGNGKDIQKSKVVDEQVDVYVIGWDSENNYVINILTFKKIKQ
jgi:hypothetical protein